MTQFASTCYIAHCGNIQTRLSKVVSYSVQNNFTRKFVKKKFNSHNNNSMKDKHLSFFVSCEYRQNGLVLIKTAANWLGLE